ncbi:hypothetical protein E2562_013285 [Oryza meyeriana var. granulata]|uniref:RRM domain-containing protein n=1 Tax=Oryza meyeriana var. granulata TaxID=110450 RepID=A0A6G1D3H0_9ORYZ|nr:hypothetical protein E2562_013285 [Oryza meyeriana var. granulata]KAF0906897.1 hypothetical protein E2562_013285 [Oryza meyeriana var. granulata]
MKRRNVITGLRDSASHEEFEVYIYSLTGAREPRGFGFVQYYDPDDAADAKYYMDGQVILGREIAVVFAEENRKKPSEMRARDRISGSRGRSYDQRYSRSPRYSPPPRGRSPYRSPSYSRSPPPRYARRRIRERSYSPVDSRSRSRSPIEEGYGGSTWRERSLSVSG